MLYEKEIEKLIRKMGDSRKVEHDAKILGRASKKYRQVDVWVEGEAIGMPLTTAVECKYYKKKRIGIDIVESFIGKLLDIGADRGIMYSYAGFTIDAEQRARGSRQPSLETRE